MAGLRGGLPARSLFTLLMIFFQQRTQTAAADAKKKKKKMQFAVSTRAACQRADWDSRQLSPSSGGGSDIKCCFQSCDAEPLSPEALRPNLSLCH